jgi:hypothetical protein
MGNTTYNVHSRIGRSLSAGYATKTANEIFTQNIERKIHESMEPRQALLREARDSAAHPMSVPIILGLDLTGSMGHIPHELIKDGLPTMISQIIQRATPDPALLFLGIGDHECDRAPLQVGQFESGDLELDTWLTRTYIEGSGGANAGESYLLAWYYAVNHTKTDAWEKRKQKGFLITIGDEPCLPALPKNIIGGLMGTTPQAAFTAAELVKQAQEQWNVFHIHLNHGYRGEAGPSWKELLGQQVITITDSTKVPTIVAELIEKNLPRTQAISPLLTPTVKKEGTVSEEPLL